MHLFPLKMALQQMIGPMLDSSHMNTKSGMGAKSNPSSFAHCLPALNRGWFGKVWLVLPVLLLYVVPFYAQGPSTMSAPDAAQSFGAQDCSNPLQSSAQGCAAQAQDLSGTLPVQPVGALPASGAGAQSGRLSGTYSDVYPSSQRSTSGAAVQPTLLPSEPLTEFQKFAASTTGQVLPIFGADLFRRVPSTFAPLDMAPVPANYVIGPGDELRVRVWGQVNFQANLRVDRTGEVFLPQIGAVHVAGIPSSELDSHLRSAISRVFHNFDLTADLGQIRSIQIYIAGSARRPGVYTVSSLSSLVDALFASGGPSVQGSMRNIELRRGSEIVTHFDLYSFLIRGDKSKDVKLLPGDVIFIPPVGPQAVVTGSVRNPAIYELRAHESIADLLADAGGVSSVAAQARVSLERVESHKYREAMEVAYDGAGLTTPLEDGDLIRVFSIVPLYRKTVILRGNIANPGRFAWHPGMHVSDLIPDKESLITRNYWWKRAQLGLPAPEFEPVPGFAVQRQSAEVQQLPPQTLGPQSDQGQQHDLTGMTRGPGPAVNQRAGSVSLAAAQSEQTERNFSQQPRTQIQLLAPEIDWDYAVIERQDPKTLQTMLVPFDLGKLVLQHDASQDLELQANDVVTIFSQADVHVPLAQQTKFVTLEGEFAHAGVYTAQPGETLRHLVKRAGGLTPNAYLYGSELTRESTRAMQQARIDEYVQSLSIRIQRSSLNLASSSSGSAQDLASGAAAQSSERDLLASLRQIRATGRIVLQFLPGSSGTVSLPDIPLQDGDHFVVPSVPATVNVVGAVYDQNSFLYASGRRAGKYLQQAGGSTRDADPRHEFIIRADGEVVSRDRMTEVWGNEFNNQRMNPGDTIVVPEKVFKPSALRALVDWTQVFSQLAIGAAVINVLP